MATVNGTAGNDFIHVAGDGLVAPVGYTDNPNATDSNDVITPGTGSDYVYAGGGDDEIDLTAGDLTSGDTIDGGSGNDVLYLLNTGTSAMTLDATAFANVSHIEGIVVPARFHGAPTTISLTDALVGSSDDSHRLTVYMYNEHSTDYVNIATVDASAVTTAANSVTFIDAAYGTQSGSSFTMIGGAGADNFIFFAGADGAPSLPGTTVNGGTGASLDTLQISYNGATSASTLANVSHIEIVNFAGGGTNSIVLPDAMVGSADDSKLVTVNGGGGSDTMDASLVTTSSNHVTLLGGAGADTVKFAASNLNSGHTVNGGSDGSVDTLAFTTAGTVLTGAFTNVSHIEAVQLADGTNNVAIPDALVASADDGQLLTIFGGSGNDTIDLRSVTTTSNSFAVHAGNGNDTIDIVPNQITASDSVDGGAGIDTLALLTLGIAFNPALFPASTFDNVSHIETLAVAPRFHATPDTPTIVTLTDALVSSSDDNHRLTISFGGESLDFKNSQKVDGSGVTTATNTLLFTIGGAGTFDLTGGAGADVFRFDNDGRFGGPTLFSTVTMNGGTGPSLDSIVLSYSGTIDPTALVNTSHIEIVTLANLGPNSITLTDAMVGTADDGQLVTVNGSSYADTIDASQVTTAGNHVTLQGGAGTDSFKLAGGNFNSTDTVDGGSDGATDTLTFVGAAALAADAFANTSHIEILRLDSGTNGISLTDGLVGSADDNHLLKVYGNAGSDTIDASAVTTAANTVVFDSGAGNDTLTGGAGNDTAIYTSGFLTFDGGGGINTIDMSRFGSAIWYGFNDPSGIEMWTKDNADYSQPGTDRPLANVANALIVIGTAYSDVINGDGSDNAYVYTGGLDTFNGFGGSNTLDLSRLGSAVWYGHNDPSGIEAWTKDNSDIAQPGTWRAIVDTANVQNVIGTAYNDVINGDQNDDTYIYTGGLDTFDGAGGSNTLDLSRMTAAIWYGYNEKTGIEAWTKDNSDIALPGAAWRAIVDTANVQNVVGTVYNDTISGNGGANRFVGGSGADVLTGGGGGDTFAYGGTADSTSAAYDTIVGFDMASDRFDLPGTVTGIDAAVSSGSLSSASMDADLAAAIGASQMASHHAVLFSPTAGSLAGHTFLIVDANGTAGYQAGQDFVFHLNSPANLASLATSDFV